MPHEIGSGKEKGSLNDDRPIDDEIDHQETQKWIGGVALGLCVHPPEHIVEANQPSN